MRCREVEGYLEDWLDGKGSPELVAHLRECARCRVHAEKVRGLGPLLAMLRQQPLTLDAAFWVRLRERIEAVQRQEAFWTAFNLLAGRTAAVLAVLLLVLSLLTIRQPQPASITGVEPIQETSLLPNGEMTSDQILLSLAEVEVRQ